MSIPKDVNRPGKGFRIASGIAGALFGPLNQWMANIYNSPKNQIKRLKKLGFSKNAYLTLGSPGLAQGSANINPALGVADTLGKFADTQRTEAETETLMNNEKFLKEKFKRAVYDRETGEWSIKPTGFTNREARHVIENNIGWKDLQMKEWEKLYQQEFASKIGELTKAEISKILDSSSLVSETLKNLKLTRDSYNTFIEAMKGTNGELDPLSALFILFLQSKSGQK